MMETFLVIFFIALFGLAVGSFLNVCIYRMPLDESVVSPPSHCTRCGTRLRAADLIPVFSYVFLGGRCRYCKEKISPRYSLTEIATAIIFVVLYLRFGLTAELGISVFLFSILIPVFFIDLEHGIIPDRLVLTGLGGGALLIVYNVFQPVSIYAGDRSWWNPIAGMFAGSGFLIGVALLGMLVYRTTEAMGMGDVKILAPIGIFLGWKLTLVALLLSILFCGVVGMGLVAAKRKKRMDTIPFGPFIVIGTFLSIMWGWDMINWYLGILIP